MTISHETLLIVDEICGQEKSLDKLPLEIRLDLFLTSHFVENGKSLFSRTYFQKLIDDGLVKLNGGPVKKRELVSYGDEIEISFPVIEELNLQPEDIPLTILYED